MSIRIRISFALLTSLAVLVTTTATIAAARRPARRDAATALVSLPREPALRSRTARLWAFTAPFGSGSSLVGSTPTGNGPSTLAVNPTTHTIYVANGNNASGNPVGGNTVSVIDSRRCNAQNVSRCKGPWPTIRVGNLPSTVAIDTATDTVYVTNAGDNTVSVFNGATCNALDTAGCDQTPATVPVGPVPIGIFADSANHTVYVANFNNLNGNTVSMIDSATCNASDLAACPTTEPPTLTVGGGPGDIDVDQATHTVYVAVSGGVSVFDANTCDATVQTGCATIGTLPGDPSGVISAKVDSADNTLYTANYDNTISAFDLSVCNAADLAGCATDTPGTVTSPQPGFETDTWVAVDAALNSVYVVFQKDDALLVVNTNVCNGRHLEACATLNPPEIHTGTDPESVALDPLTQTLYTADQVDNDVSVIDATRCDAQTTSGCRARVPEVPTAAAGLTVDRAVATTYVANGPNTNTVSMIDTSACSVHHPAGCSATPATVTVGASPSAVAVDPARHTVYVANAGAPGTTGTVSVFDDRVCNATEHSGCGNVATLDVPDGNPVALAVNPRTDTIYVATLTGDGGPNLISVFNGNTCNATTTGGCGQTPATVATGPDGGGPFASTEAVAVNPSTNTIYATSVVLFANPFVGDTVYMIDGPTCDAADTTGCGYPPATISVGSVPFFGDANPLGLAVDQATDTIYTANIFNGEGPGTVSVINGATCNAQSTSGCDQTPATAPSGFGANGIAVNPITNRVYATNEEDSSVTTINGNTCNSINRTGCDHARTQAIVGDYPTSISIDAPVETAYVADADGVSVMPLTP